MALDAEDGSYWGATPNDLTCTAYFAYSTGLFVKICKALKRDALAREYTALYEKIADKFQSAFLDENGVMTVQTQTAHIVALYFRLIPEKGIPGTVEGLKRLLKKENGHLVTGFVGTPYFCHALSQNGCKKEAYDLLLKEDFPSWLYQVKARGYHYLGALGRLEARRRHVEPGHEFLQSLRLRSHRRMAVPGGGRIGN